MITSRIAQKHREHAMELGVNHYLGKPYSDDELLGLIQHYAQQAHGCEFAGETNCRVGRDAPASFCSGVSRRLDHRRVRVRSRAGVVHDGQG